MAINETYLGDPQFTAKTLHSHDLTNYYSKHLLTQPTSSYESAQKQMAPMNPLWWMGTLAVAATYNTLPASIRAIMIYDEKFYLRAGAVHTEAGNVYTSLLTKKNIPKPGENLVTPRAEYIKIIQEERGKDPIHIRTHVDQRLFDHAERFFSFNNYSRIMNYYIEVLVRANNLFLRTLFAGMIIGMTGGAVLFAEQEDLEIFFHPTGKSIAPTKEWSTQAQQYYDDAGEVKALIKKYAGICDQTMKNRVVANPEMLLTEFQLNTRQFQQTELAELTKGLQDLPDISDETKMKKWMASMYLMKKNEKIYQVPIDRRKSLWGLGEQIRFEIIKMSEVNSRDNWMGFDRSKKNVNSDTTFDFPMMGKPSDFIVYMNFYDFVDSQSLTGSPETGTFSNQPNTSFSFLRNSGVDIFGLPYMLPGSYLIIHKEAFKIITYYDNTFEERFNFHLVKTWFRHTMYRPIIFQNFPGVCGFMKKFQPSAAWLAKHAVQFQDSAE